MIFTFRIELKCLKFSCKFKIKVVKMNSLHLEFLLSLVTCLKTDVALKICLYYKTLVGFERHVFRHYVS